MNNLKILPKNRDRISFLYFEHCRIEQENFAIAIFKENDKFLIPCASIGTLLLGTGTSITHAAIKTLAKECCEVHWIGEDLFKFYASGKSSSGNTKRLQHQAKFWADPIKRLAVIRQMYEFRFPGTLPVDLTLQQVRGHEGLRIRTLYAEISAKTGVIWQKRDYKQTDWQDADPINQALSIANSCLYAVCQSAINSVGYSPALGFVHTGKPLSFVYDIADLYKGKTSIPAAFEAVASIPVDLKSAVRSKCREKFVQHHIMKNLVSDIDRVLSYKSDDEDIESTCFLWDDRLDTVEAGKNWSQI